MHIVNLNRLLIACLVSAVAVAGCTPGAGEQTDAPPEVCADTAWLTYSTPPIAAEGTAPPFTQREALAGRLDPVDYPRTISVVTVGAAPGWGCAIPSVIAVGVSSLLPEGDAWEALEELPPIGEADMGDGFALLAIELPEPVTVEAGDGPWVMLGIERTACGVKAQLDPLRPHGRHWTAGEGWTEVDSQLVMGAAGCAQ